MNRKFFIKNINRIFLLGMVIFLASCGPNIPTVRKITLDQKASQPFAQSSLQKFMSQNPGASVVVRDRVSAGGVSTAAPASRVCTLIERGLMEEGYNVRDRRLFESAVSKMKDINDYAQIHQMTGTDLIFEVTHYAIDKYEVDEGYDGSGKRQQFIIQKDKTRLTPSYTLWGISIEVKVILLDANLIAGTFKYYYVPCAQGCSVSSYNEEYLQYSSSVAGESKVAGESFGEYASVKRMSNKVLSDFITKTVVPSMFKEMGVVSTQNNTPQYTPQVQSNTSQEQNNTPQVAPQVQNNTSVSACGMEIMGADLPGKYNWNDAMQACPQGWRLPTSEELQSMCKEKATIGLLTGRKYWSSDISPKKADKVIGRTFNDCKEETSDKNEECSCRCVKNASSSPQTPSDTPTTPTTEQTETTGQTETTPSVQPKNSYDVVTSISDLISHTMKEYQTTLKPEKIKEYKNDLEQLTDLPNKKQQEIATFILSITSSVNATSIPENEIAIFCKSASSKTDQAVLAFLDGECVGVGTIKKGLFTNLPKEKYGQGIQTLTVYSCDFNFEKQFSSPINFSLKNYYQLQYSARGYVLFN